MVLLSDLMTCTHRLWDQPDSPTCTRTDAHDADGKGGHTYTPSRGTEPPDGTHNDTTQDW